MIKFSREKIKNVLSVNSDFFSIVSQDEETYSLEIKYKIRQTDIVNLDLSTVKISVFSKNVIRPNDGSSKSFNQNFENSLQLYSISKRKNEEQKSFLLGEHVEDLSKFVDNSLVKKIQTTPKELISQFYKKKIKNLDTESLKNKKNILYFQTENLSLLKKNLQDFKENYQKLLMIEKIDFSSLSNKKKRIDRNSIDYLNGLGDSRELSVSEGVINFKNSLPVNKAQNIKSYFEDSFDDFLEFTSTLKIKKSSTFKIIFNLFKTNNAYPVDTQSFFEVFSDKNFVSNNIKFSPDVTYVNGFLSIHQKDENANQVSIFCRKLDEKEYTFFGNAKVSSGESVLFKTKPELQDVLYRIIPEKDGSISPIYTNQIVLSKKENNNFFLKLYASILEDGDVVLTAENLPKNSISIQFLYRNLNNGINQKFENLNKLIVLNDSENNSKVETFIKHLISFCTYEFSAKINFKDGLSKNLGNFSFFYVNKNILNLKEKSIRVYELLRENDISFKINTIFDDQKIDIISEVLEKNKNSDSFSSELKEKRGDRKNIHFFEIIRTEIESWKHDNLGIVSDEVFSDKKMSEKTGIVPADPNKDYLYKASLLSANPESVFFDLNLEKTNKKTKKMYLYKPFKFVNNFTKATGTTPTSNKNFDLFKTGIETQVFVKSQTTTISSIKNIVSELENKKRVKISIFSEGNLKNFDHFALFKSINGEKFQVASLHNQWSNNVFFFYDLLNSDIGDVVFSILPVYWDFSLDAELFSNSIFVEN